MNKHELLAALIKRLNEIDKRNQEIIEIMIGKRARPETELCDHHGGIKIKDISGSKGGV